MAPNNKSLYSMLGLRILARARCTGSNIAGGRSGMETEGGVVIRPSSRFSSTTSPKSSNTFFLSEVWRPMMYSDGSWTISSSPPGTTGTSECESRRGCSREQTVWTADVRAVKLEEMKRMLTSQRRVERRWIMLWTPMLCRSLKAPVEV
jgi:hypothetical protein